MDQTSLLFGIPRLGRAARQQQQQQQQEQQQQSHKDHNNNNNHDNEPAQAAVPHSASAQLAMQRRPVQEQQQTAAAAAASNGGWPPVFFWMSELSLMTMSLVKSFARHTKGPHHATWSTTAEAVVELIRSVLRRNSQLFSIQELRARIPLQRMPTIAGTVVSKVTVDGVRAEWVVHASAKQTTRVVFYIHGGAYVLLHPPFYRTLTSSLSRVLCAKVLAVDYRLAPEHPYPCGLDDCLAVYNWMISPTGGNVDARNVVFMGDSAGGGMLTAVMLRCREAGMALPGAAVLLSPWVNLACDEPSWVDNEPHDYLINNTYAVSARDFGRMYAPPNLFRDPFVSPMFANLTGFPPLLIMYGELEMPRDQAVHLAVKAINCGVTTEVHCEPEMVHVYPLLATAFPRQTRTAFNRISAFVTEHLGPMPAIKGPSVPAVTADDVTRHDGHEEPAGAESVDPVDPSAPVSLEELVCADEVDTIAAMANANVTVNGDGNVMADTPAKRPSMPDHQYLAKPLPPLPADASATASPQPDFVHVSMSPAMNTSSPQMQHDM